MMMINKYQEALDLLYELSWRFSDLTDNRHIRIKVAKVDLQELVDKATGQKKHIENCKEREYINHNYCYACGQKLDWSEEDE